MPLGLEIGLCPGHIVLHGDWASPQKRGTAPHFWIMFILLWPNVWMDQDATWYEDRPRPRPYCVTWGSSCPKKGHSPLPPIFSPCLLSQCCGQMVTHLSYCWPLVASNFAKCWLIFKILSPMVLAVNFRTKLETELERHLFFWKQCGLYNIFTSICLSLRAIVQQMVVNDMTWRTHVVCHIIWLFMSPFWNYNNKKAIVRYWWLEVRMSKCLLDLVVIMWKD